MRRHGGSAWQNVTDHQQIELAEQVRADPLFDHILPKYDEVFDTTVANPLRDLRQARSHFGGSDSQQPGPGAVWISVCIQQEPVAWTAPRNRIRNRFELLRQL